MLRLYDGQAIPAIGLGTRNMAAKAHIALFITAIKTGYRMFDTAHIYRNETILGQAIREAIAEGLVRREELFIVSKLGPQFHHPDLVMRGCQISLSRLGLDYIDLYLLNAPVGVVHKTDEYAFSRNPHDEVVIDERLDPISTWRALEKCKIDKLARAIGVCNFNIAQLTEILDDPNGIKPAVVQVECHMGFRQDEMRRFCKTHGILMMAHTPLGFPQNNHISFLSSSELQKMANRYNKTTAQLAIRYLLEKGIIPIPKSANASRMVENFNVFDFDLSDNDMLILDDMFLEHRITTLDWMKKSPHYPFVTSDKKEPE